MNATVDDIRCVGPIPRCAYYHYAQGVRSITGNVAVAVVAVADDNGVVDCGSDTAFVVFVPVVDDVVIVIVAVACVVVYCGSAVAVVVVLVVVEIVVDSISDVGGCIGVDIDGCGCGCSSSCFVKYWNEHTSDG